MSKQRLDGNEGRNNFYPSFKYISYFFLHKTLLYSKYFYSFRVQDTSAYRKQEMHLNLQENQGYREDYIPYFLEHCLNSRRDPALQT